MVVYINGEARALQQPQTISEFLETHQLNEKMIVIEHNRVIITRERYMEVVLNDGDEVEIVQMMAGG